MSEVQTSVSADSRPAGVSFSMSQHMLCWGFVDPKFPCPTSPHPTGTHIIGGPLENKQEGSRKYMRGEKNRDRIKQMIRPASITADLSQWTLGASRGRSQGVAVTPLNANMSQPISSNP